MKYLEQCNVFTQPTKVASTYTITASFERFFFFFTQRRITKMYRFYTRRRVPVVFSYLILLLIPRLSNHFNVRRL